MFRGVPGSSEIKQVDLNLKIALEFVGQGLTDASSSSGGAELLYNTKCDFILSWTGRNVAGDRAEAL